MCNIIRIHVYIYICIHILGQDCLIERVKRWLVSCGADLESRAGKLERPNARRPRNLCVLLFVCDLSVDRGQPASKEKAEDAARKSHEHRAKITEQPIENQRKIVQNRGQIDNKIVLEPFWAPKAVSGTRRDTLGTGLGPPKIAPGSILGSLG